MNCQLIRISCSVLISLLVMVSSAQAQLSRPRDAPTREQAMQILDYGRPTITASGNIIFRFPNYDISIQGAPEYAGQGNGRAADPSDSTGQTREQVSTRVIYKSPNGSWDGSNFALNPNYNYSYANNFYRNRIVSPVLEDPTGEDCPEPGVWVPRYRDRFAAQRKRQTPYEQVSPPRVAKSLATLKRLYDQGPSFTYAPTPNNISSPAPSSNRSSKTASGNAKQRHSGQPDSSAGGKELLWELDQADSNKNWDKYQIESTRQIKLRQRKHARLQPVDTSKVPQRLSVESD